MFNRVCESSVFFLRWYLTLIALFLGIVIGVVYVAPYNSKQGVCFSVMTGLSASGLYSGSKALVEKEGE